VILGISLCSGVEKTPACQKIFLVFGILWANYFLKSISNFQKGLICLENCGLGKGLTTELGAENTVAVSVCVNQLFWQFVLSSSSVCQICSWLRVGNWLRRVFKGLSTQSAPICLVEAGILLFRSHFLKCKGFRKTRGVLHKFIQDECFPISRGYVPSFSHHYFAS